MFTKMLKMELLKKDMMAKDLSEKLGWSPSNLSGKMRRDNFSEKEMQEIAEALECDLKITFTDKKSGKEFSN